MNSVTGSGLDNCDSAGSRQKGGDSNRNKMHDEDKDYLALECVFGVLMDVALA